MLLSKLTICLRLQPGSLWNKTNVLWEINHSIVGNQSFKTGFHLAMSKKKLDKRGWRWKGDVGERVTRLKVSSLSRVQYTWFSHTGKELEKVIKVWLDSSWVPNMLVVFSAGLRHTLHKKYWYFWQKTLKLFCFTLCQKWRYDHPNFGPMRTNEYKEKI